MDAGRELRESAAAAAPTEADARVVGQPAREAAIGRSVGRVTRSGRVSFGRAACCFMRDSWREANECADRRGGARDAQSRGDLNRFGFVS